MSSGPAGREEEEDGRESASEVTRRTARWVDCEMRKCIRRGARTNRRLRLSALGADLRVAHEGSQPTECVIGSWWAHFNICYKSKVLCLCENSKSTLDSGLFCIWCCSFSFLSFFWKGAGGISQVSTSLNELTNLLNKVIRLELPAKLYAPLSLKATKSLRSSFMLLKATTSCVNVPLPFPYFHRCSYSTAFRLTCMQKISWHCVNTSLSKQLNSWQKKNAAGLWKYLANPGVTDGTYFTLSVHEKAEGG